MLEIANEGLSLSYPSKGSICRMFRPCSMYSPQLVDPMSLTLCDPNGDFLARWTQNLGSGLPDVITLNLFTVEKMHLGLEICYNM